MPLVFNNTRQSDGSGTSTQIPAWLRRQTQQYQQQQQAAQQATRPTQQMLNASQATTAENRLARMQAYYQSHATHGNSYAYNTAYPGTLTSQMRANAAYAQRMQAQARAATAAQRYQMQANAYPSGMTASQWMGSGYGSSPKQNPWQMYTGQNMPYVRNALNTNPAAYANTRGQKAYSDRLNLMAAESLIATPTYTDTGSGGYYGGGGYYDGYPYYGGGGYSNDYDPINQWYQQLVQWTISPVR